MLNASCHTCGQMPVPLGALNIHATSTPSSIRPPVEIRDATAGFVFVIIMFSLREIGLCHCQKVICDHYKYCSSNQIGLRHVNDAGEANLKVLLPM